MTGEKPIGVVELKVEGYRCRCGHEWIARNKDERPRVCPSCKSPNWDKEYKFRRPAKAS
jgi:predicted Zn-ribbon and HTH transcriptional regulator